MKCPNCGFEIKDGKMYCEKCGAELLVVPEVEFDIEKEMKKTMSDIVSNEFADEYDIEFDDDPNLISILLSKQKSGKPFYFALAFVLVAIIVAAVILGRKISSQNNYEYQIEQANEKVSENDLLSAISYLENAYRINPNSDILFSIADYYYTLGRDNDACYTLSDITKGEFPMADIDLAYKKIIALLSNSNSYELIATYLTDCKSENIVNEYSDYMISVPEFNIEAGTYDETKTLKLSNPYGNGTIYYTLDGTVPNVNSSVFEGPIFLEYGTYSVNAVFVNKYGVMSEVASAKYLIDVDFVFEPEILTDSGTYTEATLIEADVPVLYTLYYTTDGSEPTKESTRYVSPIPMKEGETTYKFVCFAADGTMSSVVERTYKLELDVTYTAAQAVSHLNQFLIDTGYVNPDGRTKEGVNGVVQFMYSAIYPVAEMGTYYLVVEYYLDDLGNLINSNNIYAVNCNDLSIYKVKANGNGDYTLISFY